MLRLAVSLVCALLFSLGFLLLLKYSITLREQKTTAEDNLRLIEFVRLKKESALVKKERLKAKKPEPKKIIEKPRVNIPRPKSQKNTPQPMQKLDFQVPLDLAASSALGDAFVATGNAERVVNANVIPLVRINPVYPQRAKMMKKEGYVKLEFTITEQGTVKDVEVVEAAPKRLFNHAAKRALLKWKFKPKLVDNKPVEQRGSIRIEFKLKS